MTQPVDFTHEHKPWNQSYRKKLSPKSPDTRTQRLSVIHGISNLVFIGIWLSQIQLSIICLCVPSHTATGDCLRWFVCLGVCLFVRFPVLSNFVMKRIIYIPWDCRGKLEKVFWEKKHSCGFVYQNRPIYTFSSSKYKTSAFYRRY